MWIVLDQLPAIALASVEVVAVSRTLTQSMDNWWWHLKVSKANEQSLFVAKSTPVHHQLHIKNMQWLGINEHQGN